MNRQQAKRLAHRLVAELMERGTGCPEYEDGTTDPAHPQHQDQLRLEAAWQELAHQHWRKSGE